MASVFKVWVHVEEIDEDIDLYEDCGEPIPIAEFETLAEAETVADNLSDANAYGCYKCPECGSKQVEGGSMDFNGPQIEVEMGCLDCDHEWRAVYVYWGNN